MNTLRVWAWLMRRYGMSHIAQATEAIPVGVWRAMYSIFGEELRHGGDFRLIALANQFDAEDAAKAASDAIGGVLNGAR